MAGGRVRAAPLRGSRGPADPAPPALCTGDLPSTEAATRGRAAEGGWCPSGVSYRSGSPGALSRRGAVLRRGAVNVNNAVGARAPFSVRRAYMVVGRSKAEVTRWRQGPVPAASGTRDDRARAQLVLCHTPHPRCGGCVMKLSGIPARPEMAARWNVSGDRGGCRRGSVPSGEDRRFRKFH